MKYMQMLAAIDKATRADTPYMLKTYGAYQFPYYHMFWLLSKQCETAVELGVEKGRGCAALAMGNPKCFVYGLDTHPREEALELSAELHNFTFLNKASMPVPSGIPDRIDLLHIDTEHSYAMALSEFNAYKSRLSVGAVVCFDDTHAMESDVLRYVITLPYPMVLDDRLHPTCGYAVVYYTG